MARHRWLTLLAAAGATALIVGTAVAQSTTTSPQPAPSPTQPSPPAPSVGTPPGKGSPTTAQPGATQPRSGQMGSSTGTIDSPKQPATNGAASAEQAKDVQKALQAKGMDPGPIDGIVGPRTQAALRAFQKDQKLPETGQVDAETLAKLGVSR